MFKNTLLPTKQLRDYKIYLSIYRAFQKSFVLSNGKSALNRQAKVMNKLFGSRISGSKQRWYPSSNEQHNKIRENGVFLTQHVNKPTAGAAGKSATRRITVLNKLFMKHVTDQLVSGKAAELVAGYGLQITRVRVTIDFAYVNIYWLGSEHDLLAKAELERRLQTCGGILRHELSQLCLMGHVPRIKFVHDKKLANINEVEELLRNMQFEDDLDIDYEVDAKQVSELKANFYGDNTPKNVAMPEMRHDVLGLNHAAIMSKILLKMRKSKLAWEQHNNKSSSYTVPNRNSEIILSELQQKLVQQTYEDNEKFKQFLVERKKNQQLLDEKNTKRHWMANEYAATNAAITPEGYEDIDLLTKEQRHLYEQQDYLSDDESDEPTKS